jgi:hypothetical protein
MLPNTYLPFMVAAPISISISMKYHKIHEIESNGE